MPLEIIVPRLGWSMEEGTFVGWYKNEGDPVRVGEVLFGLEGDKATQEIESVDSGILHIPSTSAQSGESVKVGQILGYLLAVGETVESIQSGRKDLEKGVTDSVADAAGDESQTSRETEFLKDFENFGKIRSRISPRARKLAQELGLDFRMITGSGRFGRIRERDVRTFASQKKGLKSTGSLRRTIAERMLRSLQNTAPVTLISTLDATALVQIRDRFKQHLPPNQSLPSYSDLIMVACAEVLKQHPVVNSRWEGDQVHRFTEVHIGFAVDTEPGLVVPVIHDAHLLGLFQIANRSQDLAQKAREGTLVSEEVKGGTFTVTNLGAFGIDAFTPIINYPEVAVLGIGRIQKQPVVRGEAIEIGQVLTLSLTFDHCALDGAPAAKFLQALCLSIEQITAPEKERD